MTERCGSRRSAILDHLSYFMRALFQERENIIKTFAVISAKFTVSREKTGVQNIYSVDINIRLYEREIFSD